jgi:hypothetical protein
MPWLAASPFRRHVALRKAAYAPLWGYLLKHPRTKPQDLARLAASYFREKTDSPELAHVEALWKASRPFTFAGLAELNGDTAAALASARRGLSRLSLACETNESWDGVLPEVWELLERFCRQSHHVRALGALLLSRAQTAAVRKGIVRTATFEPGEGAALVATR